MEEENNIPINLAQEHTADASDEAASAKRAGIHPPPSTIQTGAC